MSIPGRSTFLPVADRYRLPHQDSGRSVFDQARGRRHHDERHASRFEHVAAGEHHEVTGEAIGTFHYDGPRAVIHQAFEHLCEA
jgi:hypothetical protein